MDECAGMPVRRGLMLTQADVDQVTAMRDWLVRRRSA